MLCPFLKGCKTWCIKCGSNHFVCLRAVGLWGICWPWHLWRRRSSFTSRRLWVTQRAREPGFVEEILGLCCFSHFFLKEAARNTNRGQIYCYLMIVYCWMFTGPQGFGMLVGSVLRQSPKLWVVSISEMTGIDLSIWAKQEVHRAGGFAR